MSSSTTKKKNYKLVRGLDNKTMYSDDIKWIAWNEEGRIKKTFNRPAIGRSLIMYEPGKFSTYYNWLTPVITDIILIRKDYIEFETENTNYKLYINGRR